MKNIHNYKLVGLDIVIKTIGAIILKVSPQRKSTDKPVADYSYE